MTWRRIAWLALAAATITASCRRESTLSTEDIAGEWRKTDGKLPPVSLLLTSEGVGLRARLRLSGREVNGRARVDGSELSVKFDGDSGVLTGEFLSKTQLLIRLRPDGTPYSLVKRP